MYDNVFEPIALAGCTIPNRIVRTGHGTNLRFPTPEDPHSGLMAYHEARAIGGVGMSFLEAAPVHPSAALSQIPLWKDEVIWGYEKLAEMAHQNGMKLFQQLWHGGHNTANTSGRSPWSASDVPNPRAGAVPLPMTQAMIDEMIGAYAAAARRVKEGGLDGLEVHGAHGYLPAQFLSATLNRRTDEYGGPLENRVRFCIELMQAIRSVVGPDFPIGMRMSADEEYEGGSRADEMAEVAKLLAPHVDFLNISVGSYYRMYKMLSPMDDPLGYELPKSGTVSRAVDVPTIVTGRIMTVEHASRILADGLADMVSMVRALIADPEIVKKTREGRAAEIRPCIGSSQGCVGQEDPHVACVVNVSAGYEADVPLTIGRGPTRRKVLVAGGGPAGLEAARTLALGGHEVHLAEMTSHLGGQVTIAATAPHRADYGAITKWLSDEVERLGVKVNLRTFVEPDLVRELAPDAVIVATGSTPRRDGFQSVRPAHELQGCRPAARLHDLGCARLRRPGQHRRQRRRLRRHRQLRADLRMRQAPGDGRHRHARQPLRAFPGPSGRLPSGTGKRYERRAGARTVAGRRPVPVHQRPLRRRDHPLRCRDQSDPPDRTRYAPFPRRHGRDDRVQPSQP